MTFRNFLALALLPLMLGMGETDRDAQLAAILQPTVLQGERAPPQLLDAAGHAEKLREDANHQKVFVVKEVRAGSKGQQVVFVVPQFHRSPLLPVTWNSLGAALEQVQRNIDGLTTVLVQSHGVQCVGTEGTWEEDIQRSLELDQVASWNHDLRELSGEPAFSGIMAEVVNLIFPYMQRYAATLDGVGTALARMPAAGVHRFGLEDAALNARSLALLGKIRPRQEALARLQPDEQQPSEDALAEIWQNEFPAFEKQTLKPLDQLMGQLDAARKAAAHDGVENDALTRFGKLSRHVVDAVLKPDEVRAYRDYYAEVGRPSAPAPRARRLTAAQKAERARLTRELAALNAQYERVAGWEREKVAARRVLQHMKHRGAQRCMVVMGANHLDGLLRALEQQGGGAVSMVVVEPYDLEEP